MNFSILLDLSQDTAASKIPIANLLAFINAILTSSVENTVKIINSKRVIFDSRRDPYQCLGKITGSDSETIGSSHSATGNMKITPGDLGIALMSQPDSILIYDLSQENPNEYLSYLKCMFVAQTRKIPIHGYSLRNNSVIKMCSHGSGGRFLRDCTVSELFILLGNIPIQKDSYQIRCTCCNNSVNIGLVCPVCLSVFCKFRPVCLKCKSKFNFTRVL